MHADINKTATLILKKEACTLQISSYVEIHLFPVTSRFNSGYIANWTNYANSIFACKYGLHLDWRVKQVTEYGRYICLKNN